MIKEIHMKNCATYDEAGAALLDCKKVNYIYGANGSGKSTISSFLRDPDDLKYVQSAINWDSMGSMEIKVYNREFREANFEKSDIEGVFTLGEATIDDINELEDIKGELLARKQELAKNKEVLSKQELKRDGRIVQFRNDIWEAIYKKHEKTFGNAFDGCKRSKEKFSQEVIKRFQSAGQVIESLNALEDRARIVYASNPEKCELIRVDILEELKLLDEIEMSSLWSMAIVGNESLPIAKLIKQLENSDWVRSGKKYIQDSKLCPFCQKETIDTTFRMQIEQFFAGEYEESVETINALYNTYQSVTNNILNKFGNVLLQSASIIVGKLDKETFETKKALLENIIVNNDTIMQNKIKEPGRQVELESVREQISELLVMLDVTNKKIGEHNELVKNIKDAKNKLADDVWTYCLHEQKVLIEGYCRDIESIDKSIVGISKLCNSLNDNIKNLELKVVEKGKNITSVQPTVDEMNRLLKSYGFTNFLIVPSKEKKNCYQIQRKDGTLVNNTLSEGEETFISFLYFMQMTKGAIDASKVSAKKVVVLDDPICSLDSTILYVVSSMVKQLSEDVRNGKGNVEQLFVFTHNVFFHKEVAFINGRTKILNDVNYWIIRKESDVSKINAYGNKNPISTSYELLWKEIREGKEFSAITIQNIMRRIIENYFGMLGGEKEDYIKDKFQTLEEQMICESLFYWINDGSHSIPDDLFIDSNVDTVERYKAVFYKIFKETGHEAHYNMMMKVDKDLEMGSK